jgi:peptidoglycan/LPS O-acetylase OafA/YrhL
VGCLLALVLREEPVRAWFVRSGRVVFLLCLAPLAWDVYRYAANGRMTLNESIVLALMIGSTSLNPRALPGRVLEWDHLKALGIMSYSIYLWQGLFLRANWGLYGPILLAVSFMLSWRFLEQPGIQLGRKLIAKRGGQEAPAKTIPVAS